MLLTAETEILNRLYGDEGTARHRIRGQLYLLSEHVFGKLSEGICARGTFVFAKDGAFFDIDDGKSLR